MADAKKQETIEKCRSPQPAPEEEGQRPQGQSPHAKEGPEETAKNSQEEKVQELTGLLQRTQANLENYRKQMERRMEEAQQFAAKAVLQELLPIIDNFELALKNTEHVNPADFIRGVELIYSQLMELLEKQGVQPMQAEGKTFDPYLHEALLKAESEKPENVILEEFQKGFLLHGQVLRHARVKVSAGGKKQ